MASVESIERVLIPNGVDDPPQVLMWRADDCIPVIIALVIGVVIRHLLICTVIGILLVRAYRKFNSNAPDGISLHWAYWWGFFKGKGRSFKNAYARRWLP